MIIGDPVEHSLSPAMHNAAYESLGIDHEFVFVASQVDINNIEKVVDAVRVMGIRGLTCTIPHKIEVMKYLDWVDPIAEKIGAVNTVVNDNGTLKGYNTDWLGTVIPLQELLKVEKLEGLSVALIGAGGAARAMAYGVLARGAHLSIFNRSIEKAQKLAQELDAEVQSYSVDALEKDGAHNDYDIILNATSLGMGEHVDETPISKSNIEKHHVVFDAVYAPRQTRLLREAAEQGARTIQGVEMLLHQGVAQFELYTKKKAPVEVMRKMLI